MERFSPQDVPNTPGIYIFRNAAGEVIYVGKARSLRKRLSNYFQPSRSTRADPKLRALINSIDSYETMLVRTEAEALLLESRLIKQYHPRYNVELRDDKRYLHLFIDPDEPFPRLQFARIRRNDNRIYFGPFPFARVLRETADFLAKRFGLRTCNTRTPDPDQKVHCLEHQIRDCCCPCSGDVTPEQYQERLDQAIAVLRGDIKEIVQELEEEMRTYAKDLRFEDAARLRDMVGNLRTICEPRQRSFATATLERGGSAPGPEGVTDLRQALGIRREPDRIECFDMSNIRGRFAVGSMVCFVHGKPARSDYRRFRIRDAEAHDDTAMMREVLTRRYSRLVENDEQLPDLVMVDGGKGQLNTALEVLHEVGMPPTPLLGLAKKNEEVYLPGRPEPVILPRTGLALKLLQSIRDEAHRFAIGYHRQLREKRIKDSLLDEIPGIGAKRRQQLLTALGSARRIADMDVAKIAAAVPGLGPILAAQVRSFLRQRLGLENDGTNNA
jgi:excinuclease ABC subunit C